MSKKKTANKNQFGQIKYFAIVLAMLLIGYGIWYFVSKGISLDGTSIMSTDDSNVSGSSSAIGETVVRVLDIGQGDCILITTPGEKHVLIDAGDIKNKGAVTSKLKKFGVNKIEYALFTHPHSDHIGAAVNIINDCKIKNVFLPNAVNTSATYKNMMSALEKHTEIKVYQAKAGKKFSVDNVNFEILSPINDEYDDLNGYSIVLKLDYGNFSMIFMGDAEKENENELLKKYKTLDCDVIKIGHHGSKTSSTLPFIAAISPKHAIISCGKNNDYGHPNEETLKTLKKLNVSIYRTDLNGTITVRTNGEKITLSKEK